MALYQMSEQSNLPSKDYDLQLYLEWADSLARNNREAAEQFIIGMLDLQELETTPEPIDITE